MKTPRSGTARITVEEAAERTGYGRQASATATGPADAPVLVDVRELDEWRSGHVPVAEHLPLTLLLEGIALPLELQRRHLVVICRSGNRSQQATELLTASGIEAVDVIGGMLRWAEAGLPVVDGRGLRGTVA